MKIEETSTKSNGKDDQLIKNTPLNEKPESSATHFNLFPPRGIFANLNFEDLFDSSNKNGGKKTDNLGNKSQNDNKDKLYGPSMPECKNLNVISSININNIENTLSDDEWVEKSELPKNGSSHNKHSKHKKHKHKHKSKKKSSHKHK